MKNSSITEAMMMTAGEGTRLRPFTQWRAKPLLPVMGIPVVQYVLGSLIHSGVTRVVANVHHHSEETSRGLQNLEGAQGSLQISDESALLLGSAGGVRNALPKFHSDSFFFANGDVLCDLDWASLAAHHTKLRLSQGVNVTLAVFPKSPPGENYREILFDFQTHLITGLGQRKVGCPFFVGAAVLDRDACAHIPPEGPADFVTSILQPAIHARKAGIYLCTGSWYDVGSPLLWHHTHLSLIEKLETGSFFTPISRLWRAWIESQNFRLAHRLWMSRGSPRPRRVSQWVGPSYWDGRGVKRCSIPSSLGPSAILYGDAEEDQRYQNGIGIHKLWTPV